MRLCCHLAVAACLSLSLTLVSAMYDDDADLYSDGNKKDYLRFGRGNHYMRFGRAADLADERMDQDDDIQRFRRVDPIIRIGRDKAFLRFGRPDAIIRFGRSELDSELDNLEKREHKVYHVGKRADPLIRFGKRADPLIRFGKRRDGIIRIGRADPIIRIGRADPIIRMGKRDPIPRFDEKREKSDMDGLEELPESSNEYRANNRKKRSTSSAETRDVTAQVVQRSWPPHKRDGAGYMRFGRADFMRFGRASDRSYDQLRDFVQNMNVESDTDKRDGGYMRFGR